MNLWIPSSSSKVPSQAESVVILVQYAPDPANTMQIVGFYEDGVFYDLQTGSPVEGPIIAWTPTTPNRK